MDQLIEWIFPFSNYLFMRRALVICVAISLSCTPVGVLLIQKRMSLMGEAISHGILPGIALSYFLWGMWLPGFCVGGIAAGILVMLISQKISQKTHIYEDASLGNFYLIALALGVLLLSINGGQMNIVHLLFGNVLAVDMQWLIFVCATSTLTLLALVFIYRPLVYDCFDPLFMSSVGVKHSIFKSIFLILMTANLVAACQALGTLMALGIMIIPSVTATILSKRLFHIMIIASVLALLSSYLGLVLSYHYNLPSGPLIVLVNGILHVLVLLRNCKRVVACT
ncbi:MAG: metal ABC transporter permease [Alphaproteobacteria bacterium]